MTGGGGFRDGDDVITRMGKVSLTVEEEEEIVIEDSIRAKAVDLCAPSLAGKLLTDKYFNKAVMNLKDTFKRVWGLQAELRFVNLGENLSRLRSSPKDQRKKVFHTANF